MTPIAIDRNINKINKWLDIYSEDEVNEWILISIENWWKGLFDKKEKSSAKQEKIKCAYEQDKDFKW